MKTFLLLWILSQTGLSSAQMDQQCCPGKKSATLVPAFTLTPTTSTLITNHTTAPPTNHTTATPTNHTTASPTNHTTASPTNHTTATPTNHTTASPTNHTTATPTNHTTASPTNHTTASPTNHTTATPTNHTTATPTNHTTAFPTTNPSAVGDYSVSIGSDTCLRVVMGITLHVQYNTINQQWGTFPVPVPPLTSASGNCTNQTATLQLSFPEGYLRFTFQKNTTRKVFYLSRIQVSLDHSFSETPNTHIYAENSSLQEYETSLGRSYKCKDTKIYVSESVILEATQEQVQAFGLNGGQFSEANQCAADTVNLAVPIAIIVILIALIAIVIIAYLVSRKRTHSGYQTL
ncbi:macrosialin isoform X2 [Microcaecilia unicolor]|uniref:Macrosialin isoform X2 n=1 Tax=Microcaecilia unicolor TaxID=1415580 RepID=A0A6P7WQX1_9AMPH|nr:macrosialin isoform X2 [Microcaecilia unicolor]